MSAITAGRELTPQEMAKPGSKRHTQMVTSSKVASMLRDENGDFLGIGYDSAYDTYQYLTGAAEKDTTGYEDMFRYGHAAEKFARYWLQDTMPGWRFSPGEVAFGHHPDLDFPHQATVDMRASRGNARKIIEVKAPMKDRGVEDKWLPQLTMNMAVSGIYSALLVLVPRYGEVAIHEIEFDEDLWAAIVEDTNDFWRRIQENDAPPVGDSTLWRDQQGKLHNPNAQAGPVELNEGYTEAWERAVQQLDLATKNLEVVKNSIIEQMGDAPRVNGADGRKIVSRKAGRFAKTRVPKEYLAKEELFTPMFDVKKLKKEYPDVHAAAVGAPSYVFEMKEWTNDD